MEPLFVPLKTRWFRAFASGEKTIEYRPFGPRWNESTCVVGRPVTLSHGYSGDRLRTRVRSFRIIPIERAPIAARELYAGRVNWIAAIGLDPPTYMSRS